MDEIAIDIRKKFNISPFGHCLLQAMRSAQKSEFSANDLVNWGWVWDDVQIAYALIRELRFSGYVERALGESNSVPFPERKYRCTEVRHA